MNARTSEKNEKQEVVATGKALQLAARWLGLQEAEVDKEGETEDVISSGFGQYAGLGYGKKKPSKKNMWKLEEKLSGTMSHSAKKRKHPIEPSVERNAKKRYGKKVQSEVPEDDEEEEVGRSGVFPSSKGSSIREKLLARPSNNSGKKKATKEPIDN